MRRFLFVTILLAVGGYGAFSQTLYMNLLQESVETVISNPAVITAEPVIVDQMLIFSDASSTRVSTIAEEDESVEEVLLEQVPTLTPGFSMSIETSISPGCKYLQLPLRYSFGQFSINSSIPYFYDRSVDYAHGTVSTTGIGDMQLGLSYRMDGENFSFEPNVNAKLPTGNESKQVDGYLVPLGTGSFDMVAGGVFTYHRNRFRINNNLSYRLSGESTRDVLVLHEEGTEKIEYNITNGNTILLNSTFNYTVTNEIVLRGGLNTVINSDGKMSRVHRYDWSEEGRENVVKHSNLNAYQEFIHADLTAGVQVSLFGANVIFTLKQPLYTMQNENTPHSDRKLEFYFRFNQSIL